MKGHGSRNLVHDPEFSRSGDPSFGRALSRTFAPGSNVPEFFPKKAEKSFGAIRTVLCLSVSGEPKYGQTISNQNSEKENRGGEGLGALSGLFLI